MPDTAELSAHQLECRVLEAVAQWRDEANPKIMPNGEAQPGGLDAIPMILLRAEFDGATADGQGVGLEQTVAGLLADGRLAAEPESTPVEGEWVIPDLCRVRLTHDGDMRRARWLKGNIEQEATEPIAAPLLKLSPNGWDWLREHSRKYRPVEDADDEAIVRAVRLVLSKGARDFEHFADLTRCEGWFPEELLTETVSRVLGDQFGLYLKARDPSSAMRVRKVVDDMIRWGEVEREFRDFRDWWPEQVRKQNCVRLTRWGKKDLCDDDDEIVYPAWLCDIAVRVDELVAPAKAMQHARKLVRKFATEYDPLPPNGRHEPPVLLPKRAMTLPEKYATLAAIRDSVCRPAEPIDPWPDLPTDPRQLPDGSTTYITLRNSVAGAFRPGPHLVSGQSWLEERDEPRLRSMLADVDADLTRLAKRSQRRSQSQSDGKRSAARQKQNKAVPSAHVTVLADFSGATIAESVVNAAVVAADKGLNVPDSVGTTGQAKSKGATAPKRPKKAGRKRLVSPALDEEIATEWDQSPCNTFEEFASTQVGRRLWDELQANGRKGSAARQLYLARERFRHQERRAVK